MPEIESVGFTSRQTKTAIGPRLNRNFPLRGNSSFFTTTGPTPTTSCAIHSSRAPGCCRRTPRPRWRIFLPANSPTTRARASSRTRGSSQCKTQAGHELPAASSRADSPAAIRGRARAARRDCRTDVALPGPGDRLPQAAREIRYQRLQHEPEKEGGPRSSLGAGSRRDSRAPWAPACRGRAASL